MSEIGKLRTPNTSGGSISAGVIVNELDLLNKLLVRAVNAEAERDEWKTCSETAQTQREEWSALADKLFEQNERVQGALDAAGVEIHHPADECGERKPMTLAERVQWLKKERDDWKEIARDWKRVAHDNEARSAKAEAALESAQKMCDHWEKKAAERQGQVNEWKEKAKKLFDQYAQVRDALEKSEASVKALHDAVDYLEGKSQLQESRLEQAWDKLRRQKDIANPVDWERVRIEAAIAAMQGMWASPCDRFGKSMEVVAVECADDLVAELQKKEVQG